MNDYRDSQRPNVIVEKNSIRDETTGRRKTQVDIVLFIVCSDVQRSANLGY
jgi:hypothetical protein